MLGIINLRREILGSRIANVDKLEMHHAFIVLFVHLEGIKVFRRVIHPTTVVSLVAFVGIEQVAVNAHGIDAFFPILRGVTSLEAALDRKVAAENLVATVEQVFRCFRLGAH